MTLVVTRGGSHANDTYGLLSYQHQIRAELYFGQSIVSTLLAVAAIYAGISNQIALYLTFIVAVLNGMGALLTGYIGVRQLRQRKMDKQNGKSPSSTKGTSVGGSNGGNGS